MGGANEKRDKGAESLLKIIVQTYKILERYGYLSTWSSKDPKYDQPKWDYLEYIILKMLKVKDKSRNLNRAKIKQLTACKGTHTKLSVEFSAEILQARRE